MWEYNYLQHYVDPNYDPEATSQYNHEYYEAHKKLKGRTKTKRPSLNEQGQEVAAYTKEQINTQKSAKLEAERARYEKERKLLSDASSRTMEQHRKIMSQRITSLQNILKRMPESQKAEQSPKIQALIYKLKEDNDKKRKDIQQKYQKDSKSASEKSYATRTAIREEAKSQYNDIYDRIASDSRYLKAKKKK